MMRRQRLLFALERAVRLVNLPEPLGGFSPPSIIPGGPVRMPLAGKVAVGPLNLLRALVQPVRTGPVGQTLRQQEDPVLLQQVRTVAGEPQLVYRAPVLPVVMRLRAGHYLPHDGQNAAISPLVEIGLIQREPGVEANGV